MLHYLGLVIKFLFLAAAIALVSVPVAAQDAAQDDAAQDDAAQDDAAQDDAAQDGEENGAQEEQEEQEEEEDFPVPAFRHVDPTAPVPALRNLGTIRFITDEDFPPFSYRDAFGSLTGFNVMLAEALCADLRLDCEFVPRPWEDLATALEDDEGDAILGGLTMSPQTLQTLEFTRPYFRTLGRFAVRAGTMGQADQRALAGKRVGVMAGTAHEAFLETWFTQSEITAFEDTTEAREALRTGDLDAMFDDAVRHMFWLASPASRECCDFAGGAYLDPEYFSRPLAIAVERGDDRLLAVLDYGLDRIQASGDFATVYRLFFPLPPW